MTVTDAQAPPRLGGIDHLEWWVGNARAFAGFLASGFGFTPVAHAGPETGRRDRVSYLLQQGDVRFLVTGGLGPDNIVTDHVRRHGDGIRDIAFVVSDVDRVYEAALARGATAFRPPADDVDSTGNGTIRHAAIATYGETVHTFLDRSRYEGPFAPAFEAVAAARADRSCCRNRTHRPRRRQRRPRHARPVGRLLRAGARLRSTRALHRRGDLDGVLRAHVDRRVEPRQDRPADQRTGGGPSQEPDRGVPRVLRLARRAAHRVAHGGHRLDACAR